MELLWAYLEAAWDILKNLWLFMIAGFMLVGIAEEFVPQRSLLKYFGANDFKSLFRAAGAGFLVSACSCGAIPLAASLRDRGASTATILTFLLASPWVGFPMLMVYVSYLGWFRTLFLISLSVTVALVAGLLMAVLERRGLMVQGLHYASSSMTPPYPRSQTDQQETVECENSVCLPCEAKVKTTLLR